MSNRVTRREVLEENAPAFLKKCGYCEMQTLLRYHEPVAYTAGIYGWNFDVYEVYGLTICTGYRGMPGKIMDGVKEYESKATEIIGDYKRSYQEWKDAVEELLRELCVKNGGHD